MHARLMIPAALLTLAFAGACERAAPLTQETSQTTAPAPAQATTQTGTAQTTAPAQSEDGVIVSAQGFEVTLEDFEEAVRQSLLFAPKQLLARGGTFPEGQLKVPFFQSRIIDGLVSTKLTELEAKKRGISVTPQEVKARMESDPLLSRFHPSDQPVPANAPEHYTFESVGLTPQDREHVARAQILREKLDEALLDEVTEQEIWEAWEYAHDTVHVLLVRLDNTPDSKEIERFVKTQEEAITAHFNAHKNTFRTPMITTLDTLRIKREATLSQPERLELLSRAAELLKTQGPDTVAKQLGMAHNPSEQLVIKEDQAAARAKVGESGVTLNAPRGTYAWKVMARRESEIPELSRPLKREIASTLIRQNGASEVLKQQLVVLNKNLATFKISPTDDGSDFEDRLFKDIEPEAARLRQPNPLTRDPQGFVPMVGTHPELLKALFELTPESPHMSEPYLTSQHAWVGILVKRNVPTKQDFEAQKQANIAAYREHMSEKRFAEMMQRTWSEQYAITRDLAPLRRRYGKLEKP